MKRGFSPAATAAFVTTLVVLGLVGWSIGWLAADTELAGGEPTKGPTATAVPSRTPTPAVSRTPTPAASATATPRRTDAFAMPELVGRKFLEARQDAFKLKLGVEVRFNEPADGKPAGTVMRTNPRAKDFVYPGLTIFLYVSGPPPKVTVPVLAGKTCEEAKDVLVQLGLRVGSYPGGPNGKVVKTEPPALKELVWNDPVDIHCAAP